MIPEQQKLRKKIGIPEIMYLYQKFIPKVMVLHDTDLQSNEVQERRFIQY